MKFSAVLFVFASLAVPAASSSLWDHETGLCTAKYTSKDGQDVVLEPKGCTHASYTKTFDEVSMLSAKEVKTAIAAIPDDALYVDLTNYKLEDKDFDDEIMSLLKRLKKLTYFSIFKNYLGDSTMEVGGEQRAGRQLFKRREGSTYDHRHPRVLYNMDGSVLPVCDAVHELF